jgi:general secretion pathway protein B
MSSILEALKKLEDEKSARLIGAGNIAGKVVKSGRRTKERPRWLLPLGMVVVAAVAVVVTYIATLTGYRHEHSVESTQPETVSTNQQPVSTESRQHSAPRVPPASMPSLPSTDTRIESIPPSQSIKVEKRASPTNSLPRQPESESVHRERSSEPPQLAAPSDFPPLKVAGIAWQKGNAERMAIVNGKPVTEGEVVEGAKVEEIFPDRVRFSYDEKIFDIPLGKTSGENP